MRHGDGTGSDVGQYTISLSTFVSSNIMRICIFVYQSFRAMILKTGYVRQKDWRQPADGRQYPRVLSSSSHHIAGRRGISNLI